MPTGSWLQIPVVLLTGRSAELDPPPGRVMVVSSAHTLARFANAIDLAFGRWDFACGDRPVDGMG